MDDMQDVDAQARVIKPMRCEIAMITFTGRFDKDVGTLASQMLDDAAETREDEAEGSEEEDEEDENGNKENILVPGTNLRVGSASTAAAAAAAAHGKKAKKRKQAPQTFSDAVNLKFGHSNASIKLFRSTTLTKKLKDANQPPPARMFQMAGCKHAVDLCYVMEEVLSAAAKRGMHASLEHAQLQMINMHISLGVALDLAALHRVLLQGLQPGCNSFFETEVYCGVVFKMPSRNPPPKSRKSELKDQASCLIFATGRAIIIARCPEDLAMMYTHVCGIVEREAGSIVRATQDPPRAKALTWSMFAKAMPGLCHTHRPTTRIVPGCAYCAAHGNCFYAAA